MLYEFLHYKNKSTHTFLIRPALAWSPHSQGEDEGEQLLHVHYVGYNESWREWLPRASSRIARSASRVRALFNFTYITTAGVECSGAYHVEGKLRGGLLELAPQRRAPSPPRPVAPLPPRSLAPSSPRPLAPSPRLWHSSLSIRA